MRRAAFLTFILAVPGSLLATNISVSQPLLVDYNQTGGTVDVRFNISWQNSWRTSSAPGNWDAAWIFLKFRVGSADPTRTGVSSAGTTLNVGSTALLRVGMPLVRTTGTGTLAANTVITAIPNGTQVTISAAPTTALTGATVRFIRIWEHARLAGDGLHLAPAGSMIRTGLLNPSAAFNSTTNYGVGAFIYRSANGTGTFTANNLELRWNHGTQGLGFGNQVEVCAFAQEMVYVTGGSFRVGGSGEYGFYTSPTITTSFLIGSEAAITVGTAAGNLYYQADFDTGDGGDRGGPIPAAFPKGFNAFYCMKYEITQGDYVDFLNKLTRQQQDARTGTALGAGVTAVTNRFVMNNTAAVGNRNGIRGPAMVSATDPITFYCDLDANGTGNGIADGQTVVCNDLSWADVAAYLDWSGLRPMTELEFEKACRGPLTPVANEYPWGTAVIANAYYNLSNPGRTNEQVTTIYATAQGNAVYQGTNYFLIGGAGGAGGFFGPLRVGILAHHTSNTGRMTSGSGYYGALDLSGNVAEVTLCLGASQGRAFNGSHGDGTLSNAGIHNAASWPTAATGTGHRGGHWYTAATACRVSDRSAANEAVATRVRSDGGRGVRTMP